MPADAAASSPNVPDPQHRIDELSAKLRESEARLALVRDAVSEGIYEWNIETNALWQSQRLREPERTTRARATSHQIRKVRLILARHPEWRRTARRAIGRRS